MAEAHFLKAGSRRQIITSPGQVGRAAAVRLYLPEGEVNGYRPARMQRLLRREIRYPVARFDGTRAMKNPRAKSREGFST